MRKQNEIFLYNIKIKTMKLTRTFEAEAYNVIIPIGRFDELRLKEQELEKLKKENHQLKNTIGELSAQLVRKITTEADEFIEAELGGRSGKNESIQDRIGERK